MNEGTEDEPAGGPDSFEERLRAIEEALAVLGAILCSPPDPLPCETADDRVHALEQIVTGAGAVLRSLG